MRHLTPIGVANIVCTVLIGMCLGFALWCCLSMLRNHPELFRRGAEPTPTYQQRPSK